MVNSYHFNFPPFWMTFWYQNPDPEARNETDQSGPGLETPLKNIRILETVFSIFFIKGLFNAHRKFTIHSFQSSLFTVYFAFTMYSVHYRIKLKDIKKIFTTFLRWKIKCWFVFSVCHRGPEMRTSLKQGQFKKYVWD